MRYRTLGRAGIMVSPYALGAMMFGTIGNPDHDDSIRIIHKALDAGINFVDTADAYSRGESEQIVGKALKGRLNRGIESEVLPVAQRYGMGTLVWSSLAKGMLTGRIRKGQQTDLRRAAIFTSFSDERRLDAVEQIIPLAERGRPDLRPTVCNRANQPGRPGSLPAHWGNDPPRNICRPRRHDQRLSLRVAV